MQSHVGSTRSQANTLVSTARGGGGGGSLNAFCNSVSNEKQMEHGSCRLSLSHAVGGRGAEHRDSTSLLIFNFIVFAKNLSTLVVVFKRSRVVL